MNIDYNFFKVSDGQSLAYKCWDNVENATGVVIIIHGMAEHIERYDPISQYLNSKGLIVYGTDHRGHGKTSGKKGLFAYTDGWNKVKNDQVEFFNFVESRHKDLKISYIAHSMGSYLARFILSTTDLPIHKIILSGTGYESGVKTSVALKLANLICKLKGPGQDAVFLDKMVNDPFAKSVDSPTTAFDWLSRDNNEVSKYVNDSNCGFICTNKFYADFFKIISYTCKTSNMKKIDKELPILLYSGEKDPVGGKNASGVLKVKTLYDKIGLNTQIIINKGGRHENINETNKSEVYTHFSDFLLGVN